MKMDSDRLQYSGLHKENETQWHQNNISGLQKENDSDGLHIVKGWR